MDKLSMILRRFSLQADVFFTGNLCQLTDFSGSNNQQGHLHMLKAGKLLVIDNNGNQQHIDAHSILFFPNGRKHRFIPDPELGADLVCANINYQDPAANPLTAALPDCLVFYLDQHPRLQHTAQWLFEEAFSELSGRLSMINKLCDVFIIQVLREVLNSQKISSGMLAGLADKHLAAVINGIHESPQYPWTLANMAEKAFMSRSKFAELFKQTVGQTPGDYLSDWRMSLVKSALLRSESVNSIANQVGYENGSALSRAFKQHSGLTPKQWQKQHLGLTER